MVAVAHHPVQRLRIGSPVQVAAHVGAQRGHRHRLGVLAQLDAAAGDRQRRHVAVEQFGEGHRLAVRAHRHVIHVLEAEDLARQFAVQAHAHQLLLQPAAGEEKHALAVGRKLRVGAVFSHLHRIDFPGRDHEHAARAAPQAAGEAAAALARIHHLAAVGRITRTVVEAGFRGERARLAGGQVELADRAHALVRPHGVEQPAAVGAEAGLVFEVHLVRGQAARFAAGQGLGPELADGVEDQGLAVGAGGHVADHLRGEVIAFQRLREPQRRQHRLRDLGGEGDIARLSAAHVHAPELALGPDHHRLRIRRPVEVRIGPEDRPGFLLVVRQAVPDRTHLARGQVQLVQHRLVADALDEGQRAPVRRGLRTHRAAGAGDDGLDLAGLAVEPPDRVDQPVHVAVVVEGAARAHVLGEIHVAAVGRDRRFALVLLVVLALGQLQAGAAAAVVHPQLARAQRAAGSEMFTSDQVLAVRRPVRVVEQAEIFLADRGGAAAVGFHAPEVVAAAAVGGEGDLLAVGREARLHVPGRAAAQAPGLAAACRQQIQVAEHREHDLLAVRAQVQVQPGAFVGAELHAFALGMRAVDVPLRRGVGGAGAGAQGEGEGERDRTERHGHSCRRDWRMLGHKPVRTP